MSKHHFLAIDVETANADMASICQIGVVEVVNDELVNEWKSYVDPRAPFDDINVGIHGIDESTVKGAPTYPELAETLHSYVEGKVIVCHTHFDRVAIHQTAQRYNLIPPTCTWLDSARVARRTWSDCAWRGYGLYNVCQLIGYDFRHHDALEDARAAAHVLLAAINETGLDVDGWLRRVERPITSAKPSTRTRTKLSGNPEGPLFGEVIVFTGSLQLPRAEAAALAVKLGCEVAPNVTKKTTIVVVGTQSMKNLAGQEKSSKHRKAEEFISHGLSIRILQESDFLDLARMVGA